MGRLFAAHKINTQSLVLPDAVMVPVSPLYDWLAFHRILHAVSHLNLQTNPDLQIQKLRL